VRAALLQTATSSMRSEQRRRRVRQRVGAAATPRVAGRQERGPLALFVEDQAIIVGASTPASCSHASATSIAPPLPSEMMVLPSAPAAPTDGAPRAKARGLYESASRALQPGRDRERSTSSSPLPVFPRRCCYSTSPQCHRRLGQCGKRRPRCTGFSAARRPRPQPQRRRGFIEEMDRATHP